MVWCLCYGGLSADALGAHSPFAEIFLNGQVSSSILPKQMTCGMELVSLAGRPTRGLISIPPDPINPAWDSREAIDMALEEGSHWTTELGIWIRFLRWRKWNFDRRVEAAPESSEPPLPDPHDVDAYALHLEFRNYLLDTVAIPEEYVLASWRNSRERLDTLEPQLAEMRAERGLPADDNPPPPALVALWADEAAKKAAELAAQPPCIQPANRRSAPGESPSPPPPRKRKREGAEDHSDEAAARAPAAMEQPVKQPPPAKRRSTRAVPAVGQPVEPLPARRRTFKGGAVTVVGSHVSSPPFHFTSSSKPPSSSPLSPQISSTGNSSSPPLSPTAGESARE